MGGHDMTGPNDDMGGPVLGLAFAAAALLLMLLA
jgi:hypothetical protein